MGTLQLALAGSHEPTNVPSPDALFKQISIKYLGHPQIQAALSQILHKDPYTYEHCLRVGEHSMRLAHKLGLDQNEIEEVYVVGILHDIGKTYTPDTILKKPGPLTAEEFGVIKTHPVDSENMVQALPDFEYLSKAVRSHHERFDGHGYPDNKTGEEIHLYSRIILVCDTFDAMTTARIYRKEVDLYATYEELERCSGTQFDPNIVLEFIAMHKDSVEGRNNETLLAKAA